ncbi:MAG: GTPase HflX [Chloroflexi bacterium]|nr:GTPase HflX [Chloroflexota bacterium]
MSDSYIPIDRQVDRAFLVAADIRAARPLLTVEDSLRELALLADTAGIEVVGQVTQKLNQINSATFIGPGKVEEVKAAIEEAQADIVIFDDELSPRHQRELEKAFGENIRVIDRSALILDIFAQHAATHEGRLQVELAQYEYRLPRLTRQWTHLARQAGGTGARGGASGVGLRGPGETQLEVDRRDISRRISKLKEELDAVRAHRQRHRQQRDKTGMPVVALVGYTNAGKSTLLKALTDADVYIANQLFATLDTTTRRVTLPGGKEILFSDTVGFIQKLPTTLIAAFRATLEGITEADVVLHVVDSSHPNMRQQVETVEDTLAQINVPRIPRLLVMNKLDLLEGDALPINEYDEPDYHGVVGVSALTGKGIDTLLERVEDIVKESMLLLRVRIPYQEGELISRLHTWGVVESEEHTGQGVIMEVRIPKQDAFRLSAYRFEEVE